MSSKHMIVKTVMSAFLLLLSSSVSSNAAQTRSASFGGMWTGGAYLNDQSGKFSHCVAMAPYKSGILVLTSVNRNYEWSLTFLNQSWKLEIGRKIPLSVSFDGSSPWTGTATVVGPTFVRVPMANDSALVRQFRGAYNMKVVAEGQTYSFNLDGTSRMLVELKNCVDDELAAERGEPRRWAGVATSPPRTVAPQPVSPPQAPAVTPAPVSGSDVSLELAAMRIASNLLLQAKLPNARIIQASETPAVFKGRGVMWVSDVGAGVVDLLPASAGKDSQQVASAVVESDARVCKGDFASGRSSELVDDRVVVKAMSSCKDSGGVRGYRYFVIQNEPSGYIVYGVALSTGAVAASDDSPLRDSAFQTAAIKAAFSR